VAFVFQYSEEQSLIDFTNASERMTKEFGSPCRATLKVQAWEVGGMGIVLQIDQPNRENASYLWTPYPEDGATVPEIALEYPAEAGRHSGTYASRGLEKGNPALKITVRTEREFIQTINYIRAMASKQPLPMVEAEQIEALPTISADPHSANTASKSEHVRREAIPRAVQREIWRRDEGRCVECSSKERLCFDHIIPFSRGGSNTIRNLQLLCERCNLSKGNRI
jgi:hypothetical protein